MSKYKKKTLLANLIAGYQNIFRCPLCSNPMKIVHLTSLICSRKHCFDLSRRGYVNFLKHPPKTKYDKSLFESRRMIWGNGFFDQLGEVPA
ncbi:putative RNA methyltransferase [Shimazuella kribbensis]|uniref:putative RNA methyltransferase n=1 Tax=Shimazuella kribbensis TaxID=139808 RepID=UPI003CCC2591